MVSLVQMYFHMLNPESSYSKRHNFDRDLAFPAHCCLFLKKMFKSDFENYYGLIWINRRISHLKLHTNFSIVIHILCQNQSVINQSHAQPMHCKTTQLRHSRQTTTSCIMKCRVQYLIIVNLWLATSMCIQKTPHCHSEMNCVLLV